MAEGGFKKRVIDEVTKGVERKIRGASRSRGGLVDDLKDKVVDEVKGGLERKGMENASRKRDYRQRKITTPGEPRSRTTSPKVNDREDEGEGERYGNSKLQNTQNGDEQPGQGEQRSKPLGSDKLDAYNAGTDTGETGKSKKFNPFSYKSVKENIVDSGLDKGAKSVLNKYYGLGSILEFANKLVTGKDKIEYSKKIPLPGKLILMAITLAIVFFSWMIVSGLFLILLFGAAGLLMDDGDSGGNSAGGGGTETVAPDTGFESGKGKPMPPELQGKFLLPNTEKVTSLLSMRFHPKDKVWRYHNGVDFTHKQSGKTDVKIYSIAPGTVYHVTDKYKNGSGGGWGNYIRIDHGGYTSLYAHLSPGVKVKVGDVIGIDTQLGVMGHTGSSTGFHLHLEIYSGGKADHGKIGNKQNALDILSCTDTKPMTKNVGLKTECYEYQKKVRGI